jgi:hypothetical protein
MEDSFIFKDFLEALLRIGHLIYKNQKDLSLHESGLVATFSYLIKTDVLPRWAEISDKTRSTATSEEHLLLATILNVSISPKMLLSFLSNHSLGC